MPYQSPSGRSFSLCPKSGLTHGTRRTGIGTTNNGIKAKMHGHNPRHGNHMKFHLPKFVPHLSGNPHLRCMMTICYMATSFTKPSSQRLKNICGLNPLTVPIGLLTRHGASEFGLRLLSEGRFLGIITTRSIAESVFGAQLLKAMRDQGIDIDTLSEHLHRTTDPDAPIPSKSEDPSGFMSPLIHAVVSKLKEISPTKQDTQALRELQLVQKKLKETEEKLRQSQKSQRTPSLPEVKTPLSDSAVGSQDIEEDPIEPFEDTHPTAAPSKKRRTTAAALGASPKAKTQRGLEAWVRRPDPSPPPKAALTAEEVMNPSKPVIRDQQPKSGSQGDLKKWMEQFDVETQQTAKKILEMLADRKYTKGKLQNAAAQYGLNVQDSLKYQPKSLQQVIAYAAAMSS